MISCWRGVGQKYACDTVEIVPSEMEYTEDQSRYGM